MDIRYAVLDLVPMWFRTRWPMKQFYWQKEDLERAEKRAKEIGEALGWGTPANKTEGE